MSGLQVDSVSVRFDGVVALDDVSMGVGPGETVGLIGPNGAGKTTLLNAVTGMVRIGAGRVSILGEDATALAPYRRARLGVRRMFQHGGLVADETVLTNVLIAQHVTGPSPSAALELLEEAGVAGLAGELVADLPTGLTRLVELACVMAGRPRLLLLDEPSSGLDTEETRRLSVVVRQHQAQSGFAALVVAHDMRFVMGLADRVVVLAEGRVIAEGTPSEVQADPAVRSLYFAGAASA